MIGKTSYCHLYDSRHKKFKEEALKVRPVISSAEKYKLDWFLGFTLGTKYVTAAQKILSNSTLLLPEQAFTVKV